jgi:hypothetical protein
MATIGQVFKCPICGFVFMIVGNPNKITLNPNKCPQKNCIGVPEKATIGWT